MARSIALVVVERGRAARPLSFSLAAAAALVVLLLSLPSQGCATGDARPISAPDSVAQKIDMGFSGDVGVGPTMGHSVPLEGEIISTPACVAEARGGQDCKK